MPNDLKTVLELLVRSFLEADDIDQKFRSVIQSIVANHKLIDEHKASTEFLSYLRQGEWKALRQWVAQAEKISLQQFLAVKAKRFFREYRQQLMSNCVINTPWDVVIREARYLPERDRILARYCLVEGLSGAALKKAVRADMHLGLATTGAITTSRSNIVKRLREHCHPDHRDMIDAVLRLRQRSGRRPKAPTRSDTSR